MSGWGNDPCTATAPDGQRCVLAPGHDGNHLTASQKTAAPLSDNQRTALVLMALVALLAVAFVFLQVKGGLDAML
jgi:hypothetical protein